MVPNRIIIVIASDSWAIFSWASSNSDRNCLAVEVDCFSEVRRASTSDSSVELADCSNRISSSNLEKCHEDASVDKKQRNKFIVGEQTLTEGRAEHGQLQLRHVHNC